jgi:hypothetical protein
MDNQPTIFNNIVKLLSDKAGVKLDATRKTEEAFVLFRKTVEQVQKDLTDAISDIDKRIIVRYTEKGPYDIELNYSDDLLIFSMHTDVFAFDDNHPVRKSSYVSEDPRRGFCGMILIYNFLTDSFRYNRQSDTGTLIARVFVNREGHFMVEGKRQMGFMFNDFESGEMNAVNIRMVVETAVLHSLRFDIFAPPFDQMKNITVQEATDKSLSGLIATGKRLGFKFQSESGSIE